MRIDLNSDLGESFGDYKIGNDQALLPYVTSVNVACGWHAGDPMVMDRTVALAKERGIGVGAHPGYYDLMGFGRRKMNLKPEEITNYIKYQVGALMAFTKSHGIRLQHVKTHGALGNLSMVDEATAHAVCRAVADLDEGLLLYSHSGAKLIDIAKQYGIRVVSEVYGDRGYTDDGMLAPRSMPGSMIHDVDEAVERSIRMICEGTVVSVTGKVIPVQADSLCVHGDTPEAVAFLERISQALRAKGIEIRNILSEEA